MQQQQPFNSTVVCVRDKAVGFFICCLGFSLQHLERRWWQIFHNALLLAVSSPFIIIVHFPVTLVPICHQALEMVPLFPWYNFKSIRITRGYGKKCSECFKNCQKCLIFYYERSEFNFAKPLLRLLKLYKTLQMCKFIKQFTL